MSIGDVLWSPAVLASFAAAFVATLGLITVARRQEWAQRHRGLFAAFASGILFTTALFLMPDVLTHGGFAVFYVLAGYLLLYAINVGFSTTRAAVLGPLLGIGLHSFIDGFEYGILFDYDLVTGLVASTGLIAHEFAEGVVLFSVLSLAGLSVRVAGIGAFVGAALTTPMGAIASQYVLADLDEVWISRLLAMAAGALLYLGATHLTTYVNQSKSRRPLVIGYALGVGLAVALSFAHSHDHDHDHSGGHDHEVHEDHDDHDSHGDHGGHDDHDSGSNHDEEADHHDHDDHGDHDGQRR